ncbi:MAG TPA: hypothetical protein VD833_23225 [Vicinamibacterales bacterium]|nr:hypothetical protein [Vicinamibacterales bacterium]
MRRLLITTAALALAAVVLLLVFLYLTGPPDSRPAVGAPDPDLAGRSVAGAYHVHTTRSDGAEDRDAVAAAAARVGLHFVIFTDHGDGTAPPMPPGYLHGVLCVDGVEISTDGGHYVALGMAAAPYPLGGSAASVVEDVRRLGGFGIAAHPGSAKPGLDWTDWSLPVDAIEWLNADSEWRDEPLSQLARVPFDYLLNPAAALASLLDRPVDVFRQWDAVSAQRPLAGLAAHDAHGGMSRRVEDGQRFAWLGMPSYEASFSAFSLTAILRERFSSDAPADARRLLEAVRAGRVFTTITAVASPGWLDFRGRQSGAAVEMGESLAGEHPTTFSVRVPRVSGGTTVLVCNGADAASSTAADLTAEIRGAGACRAEVRIAGAPGAPPVPWLVSNPIYLHGPKAPAAVPDEQPLEIALPVDERALVIEKDPSSRAELDVEGREATLDFQLGPGDRLSQYVALAGPVAPPAPEFDRIVFTAGSSRPLRLSVQLRTDAGGGARWGTSVYLPGEPLRVVIPIDRLQPYQPGTGTPERSEVTSILLVVDLTNAHPGFEGRLQVSDLALARGLPSR